MAAFLMLMVITPSLTKGALNDDLRGQTEKMRNGIPLADEDRVPWLETLRDVLRRGLADNEAPILACSALQKRTGKSLDLQTQIMNQVLMQVLLNSCCWMLGLKWLPLGWKREQPRGSISCLQSSCRPSWICFRLMKQKGYLRLMLHWILTT